MEKSMLCADHVEKYFIQDNRQIAVLKDVTVSFCQGTTYAITGQSGAGKSTLMHLLAGLDIPTAGTITYQNTNIAQLPEAARIQFLNKSIGLVFQRPYLISELSVLENIIVPGMIAGIDRIACHDRGLYLLGQVDLAQKAASKPLSLSGGQQQRVALARALFNAPAFLLADEPTGNLDENMGKAIVDLLCTWSKKHGMGLIISTHDQSVVKRMEVVYHLSHGELLLR
jgi:lipoprotein-releasing system ATP-binding protein